MCIVQIPTDPNQNDSLNKEQLDKILNKFPLLYQELSYLFSNYRIISISHTKELVFTIEFNDRVTNAKYKDRLIDYNKLK